MFAFPKEFTRFCFMGIYGNQAIIYFSLTIGTFELTCEKYIRSCSLQISFLILPPHPQILIPHSTHDFPESNVHLQPWA